MAYSRQLARFTRSMANGSFAALTLWLFWLMADGSLPAVALWQMARSLCSLDSRWLARFTRSMAYGSLPAVALWQTPLTIRNML